MKKALLKCTSGYTLIELLIAIAILGIVVAPCLGLFAFSFSAINSAGSETAAINMCRDKMEEIKALGYPKNYELYITENSSPVIEDEIADKPHYRRVTTVTVADLNAADALGLNSNLLDIEVTVYWDANGTEHSQSLRSYLASR